MFEGKHHKFYSTVIGLCTTNSINSRFSILRSPTKTKSLKIMSQLWKIGYGALQGKMLLVRIIENNKLMLILGQDRLSKGKLALQG